MPGAITTLGDTAYFWTWKENKSSVYSWNFGSDHFEKVADTDHLISIRGLSGGRFLHWEQDAYTILSVVK